MYQFPADLKKAYEESPLSFVYYQNIDGSPVPVLASAGFCRSVGVGREKVLDWLSAALYERMEPDDARVISRISDDFLHKRGSYDIVFRCRIDPASSGGEDSSERAMNMVIHGVGRWQTMPDGTELAVITYANLLSSREVSRRTVETYTGLQKDLFYKDPLTSLPNINYLHEFGDEKVHDLHAENITPYAIYTDINAMQSYNNQYGFKEGDNLLVLVAGILKEKFPKSLVTRAADDHFIVVTGAHDKDELQNQLSEINSYIRKNAFGNTTGIRFGVCPVRENEELSEALDHARHALKGIENNMNREVAFFSKDADDAYWKNRYIVENFDRALEQGWIKMYYHSLIRLENKKISAFEGLARWVDPNRGIISPADFIPVLSRYHLLYRLDLYMLEQVCREVKIRYDNSLPLLPVSVNFSRQDFDHADIVEEMNRLFKKYELEKYIDKSYFIVEITEQDLATGEEKFQEQLKRLHDEGYCIWLDDFGSGYSAINMFNRFEFDLVKFDMDLLRHLDDHGGVNRIILKELVKMIKELKIPTLVEGVETVEQISFAKEIGCELAQGFFFHKPESLDEILFRVNAGESVKMCETPWEREELNKKIFLNSSSESSGTEYKEFLDRFKRVACVMSVDMSAEGSDRYRVVDANEAYKLTVVDRVEDFTVDVPYTRYIPKAANFEALCDSCVKSNRPVHTYFDIELYNSWMEVFLMPLESADPNKKMLLFSYEMTPEADINKLTDISSETASNVIKTCLKLRETSDFQKSMKLVIADIRRQCGAQRCSILLTDFEKRQYSLLSEDYEEAPDMLPLSSYLTTDFYAVIETWPRLMNKSNCFIIADEKDMEEAHRIAPEWIDSLKRDKVASIVIFPLRSANKTIGYIWAGNFDPSKTLMIRETLSLTSFILSAEIANEQNIRKMKLMSTTDLLTGVLNRNAMNSRISDDVTGEREIKKPFCVFFIDVNGLKTINDTKGHLAGDNLLKDVSGTLLELSGGKPEIYRVGGDEFMIINEDVSRDEFEKLRDDLIAVSQRPGRAHFAVGVCHSDEDDDIRKAMQKADSRMYEAKADYYARHPEIVCNVENR